MRRVYPALLFIFLLSTRIEALNLDPLPNYQDAGTRLFVKGTQKLQEGDFLGAVQDLRQAVRARPDLADAFHNLGFALEKTGDLNSASIAYERAIILKPNYASAMNNLGFLLSTTEKEIQKAVRLCQRAVELEPSSASFRDSLGWAFYKAGRLDDAIMSFLGAIKLDPTFAKPHFNIGLCEFNKKNFQAAAREFSAAVQLNPGFIKAYLPLGVCFEKLQMNNKALYTYQQAMTKVPENSQIRKHLEKQARRLTKDSKSFYFSNVKQIQASSKLSDFLKKKDRTGNLMGSSVKSSDNLESSGSFTPVSAASVNSAGTGMDEVGEFGVPLPWGGPQASVSAAGGPGGPAPRAVSAVPQAMPTSRPVPSFSNQEGTDLTVEQERKLEKRYSLCHSYIERGLTNEAERDLEKIVALGGNSSVGRQARNLLLKVRKMQDDRNKDSASTHLAMGKDFFRAGKSDLAESEIKKALEITPGCSEAYKDLALLHYNLGRYREAYEESKKAIALDRGMKEAYVILASLYSKKGRVEDAIRTLKKVREVSTERDAVDDLADRMLQTLSAG